MPPPDFAPVFQSCVSDIEAAAEQSLLADIFFLRYIEMRITVSEQQLPLHLGLGWKQHY